MTQRRNIAWTRSKFILLCDAYKANKQAERFTITLDPEGEVTLIPAYAKYLIEYLEGEFAKAAPAAQPANEGESSYTQGSGSWEGGLDS